jgi:hypothetical protein
MDDEYRSVCLHRRIFSKFIIIGIIEFDNNDTVLVLMKNPKNCRNKKAMPDTYYSRRCNGLVLET